MKMKIVILKKEINYNNNHNDSSNRKYLDDAKEQSFEREITGDYSSVYTDGDDQSVVDSEYRVGKSKMEKKETQPL